MRRERDMQNGGGSLQVEAGRQARSACLSRVRTSLGHTCSADPDSPRLDSPSLPLSRSCLPVPCSTRDPECPLSCATATSLSLPSLSLAVAVAAAVCSAGAGEQERREKKSPSLQALSPLSAEGEILQRIIIHSLASLSPSFAPWLLLLLLLPQPSSR